MKNLKILLIVIGILLSVATVKAETTYNVRLLLHSYKQIGESPFSIAGWVIAPNVTSFPRKRFAVAGPRYDSDNWSAEVMAGAIIDNSKATMLFDAIFALNINPWLGIPVKIFSCAQWVSPMSKADKIYSYTHANYSKLLFWETILAGVETENTFHLRQNKNILSAGPHIVVPLGKRITLIVAYQLNSGINQIWLRVVSNFK